ncbi:phosphatase PAP2 family protein [Sphingomonas glaciei]|uniref:Phosphatase PAP2 family protein n=1 Tax=Sphingomonas glaciei TaxID=2938948 RepID=A0ABY5MUB7_9SPHN|nr:phosphatase PAP2 family protein [Sphingomonas glaciei]UUR08037.1 phosphatase PAP2 family protein [Sphingomonas glaciei]
MIPRIRILPALLLAAATALFLLLEWIGGATYPLDLAAIRAAGPWREAHPQAAGILILYTHLGSAYALLTMTAAGASWLWWQGQRARAAALLVAVLGARIGVEIIKAVVDRARPSLEVHPVVVHSQSFPSGHAANSMATFLALALFVAPERWRRPAVATAVTASLAMGATRPLLGVHWPSDVLAGWILGAAAALLGWWWLSRRGERSAA